MRRISEAINLPSAVSRHLVHFGFFKKCEKIETSRGEMIEVAILLDDQFRPNEYHPKIALPLYEIDGFRVHRWYVEEFVFTVLGRVNQSQQQPVLPQQRHVRRMEL